MKIFPSDHQVNSTKEAELILTVQKLLHSHGRGVMVNLVNFSLFYSFVNFSLFYSFVSYGIAVWALTHKSLLDPIIVSQKKILRIMNFKEPNSPAEPLFAQLQFLKIRDMHELQLLSFMYDCHLAPTHFQSYFTPSSEVHGYNTRLTSRGDLFLTRKTTFQYGIRSIQYSGARLWNSIPILIRESPSRTIFVTKLKTHFLSSYQSFS